MFQSLLNNFHWLLNFGVVSLVMTVVISSYIKRFDYKIAFILFIALLLKFYPGIDLTNIAFIISAAVGAAVFKKMPFDKKINLSASVIISVALFVLFSFLISPVQK